MRILDERREALVERERSASQSTRKPSAFAFSARLFLASLRALANRFNLSLRSNHRRVRPPVSRRLPRRGILHLIHHPRHPPSA
jgi:hypothetical protein